MSKNEKIPLARASEMNAKENQMAKKVQAVVVTTLHRGVFFGYLQSSPLEKIICLANARMCVHWSADVRGVVGLASTGPSAGCRIGPPAPAIIVHDVTAMFYASDEAVAKWEDSPWAK